MSTAFAPMGLLFAGILLIASGQATSVSAIASATVIAPVSVPPLPADFPVAVITSGGWIKVVMPSAQPPPLVSTSSSGGNSAAAAVDGASLTLESFKQLAASGTVQGDTVSALSLRVPKAGVAGGGRYHVTVAFN